MEGRDNNIFGYEQVAKRIANIRLTHKHEFRKLRSVLWK